MEDFKRPGTILSLANTAYLIGGTILIYRKMNEFDTKINDFSSLVNNTIKVAGDCKTYGTQIEAVKTVLSNSSRELDDLKRENRRLTRDLSDTEHRLRAILKALKDNGIEVDDRRHDRYERTSSHRLERPPSPRYDSYERYERPPSPRYDSYDRYERPPSPRYERTPRRERPLSPRRQDKVSVADLGF